MKKFKLLLILAIGFIIGLSLSTLFSSLNEFRNTYFVNVSSVILLMFILYYTFFLNTQCF